MASLSAIHTCVTLQCGLLTMGDSGLSFALFDTAIGPCGIVWTARGIAGVQLSASGEGATRIRILRRYPSARESAAPADIRHVIQRIVALLAGEPSDLRDVEIDTADMPDFNRRVYAVVRSIAQGSTLTYGEIAARLGDRSLAREVGEALGQNPIPIIVPCHRVLAADGKTGGFSGPGGVRTKMRLLEIEGAQPGGPTLFGDLPLVAVPRRQRRRT